MKVRIYFFAASLAFSQSLLAQLPDLSQDNILLETKKNKITGDERIGELENRYIEMNSSDKKINGYRIQLFSSSGANSWSQANEVQSDFLKIYPDIDAYVIHVRPSFKVRIGDYRNRMEAERFYVEIRENFPDAFIVRDRVNFPVLNIEKEEEIEPVQNSVDPKD